MADEPTLEDLKNRASELDIKGRTKMDRKGLEAAIEEAEAPDLAPADQATGADPSGANAPGDQPRPEVEAQEEDDPVSMRIGNLEQRIAALEERATNTEEKLKGSQI